MRVRTVVSLGLLTLMCSFLSLVVAEGPSTAGTTTVPRPDHVVVVVEENHSQTQIIGSPDAPYITSLSQQNANFTQSYALTHPSQPNYIGLFSGSTQGVTSDACPNTFAGANLGSQVLGAGLGFTGYSETLPSAGFTGCTSGKYARKHSPWVNFTNLPDATNQPLTAFPSDFNNLPEVSFVIPNLDHDMHDGTVAQGDTWLQQKLGDYVTWAKTHNSLFVLTFDEDDNKNANRIPTIMAGQRVVPGNYDEHIDHYSVLRTLQDAYGLAPSGSKCQRIADPRRLEPGGRWLGPDGRLQCDVSRQHLQLRRHDHRRSGSGDHGLLVGLRRRAVGVRSLALEHVWVGWPEAGEADRHRQPGQHRQRHEDGDTAGAGGLRIRRFRPHGDERLGQCGCGRSLDAERERRELLRVSGGRADEACHRGDADGLPRLHQQ